MGFIFFYGFLNSMNFRKCPILQLLVCVSMYEQQKYVFSSYIHNLLFGMDLLSKFQLSS